MRSFGNSYGVNTKLRDMNAHDAIVPQAAEQRDHGLYLFDSLAEVLGHLVDGPIQAIADH